MPSIRPLTRYFSKRFAGIIFGAIIGTDLLFIQHQTRYEEEREKLLATICHEEADSAFRRETALSLDNVTECGLNGEPLPYEIAIWRDDAGLTERSKYPQQSDSSFSQQPSCCHYSNYPISTQISNCQRFSSPVLATSPLPAVALSSAPLFSPSSAHISIPLAATADPESAPPPLFQLNALSTLPTSAEPPPPPSSNFSASISHSIPVFASGLHSSNHSFLENYTAADLPLSGRPVTANSTTALLPPHQHFGRDLSHAVTFAGPPFVIDHFSMLLPPAPAFEPDQAPSATHRIPSSSHDPNNWSAENQSLSRLSSSGIPGSITVATGLPGSTVNTTHFSCVPTSHITANQA
ncbi:unnamed protein product [Protopolystoma xenopodis]|uniref:Uncharacterized protein n=1 Tax=Protopolystoma xenopodis TaxID=117903 RepID=A0A3S5CMX0_9PLAT|nr:unnamed protein product [Protopolystoma xenopodis]